VFDIRMPLSAAACGAIDTLIESQREPLDIPGIAFAATDRGGLLYEQAYGFADLASRAPVTRETAFEIGSISKSFTAALVVRDALAGRLDLRAPVTEIVPWFAVQAQHQHPICPHHLLQHSAGLIAGSEATPEARSEVWSLRETPAIAEPGTWFHYSNVAYKLLGVILEQIHQRRYVDVLQDGILDPLGMGETSPSITNVVRQRMATGYEPFFDDLPMPAGGKLAPATWLETGTADGSIVSTAGDMAAYLRAWMTPGEVITEAIRSEVTSNTIAVDDARLPGSVYGYGWQLATVDGHHLIGHGGGMVGYRSYVLSDLDAGLGIVILTNGPWRSEELAHQLLAIVRADRAGETLPQAAAPVPEPVPELHTSAGDAIGRAGDAIPGDGLTGHWRSHNPWLTNFRTIWRDGQLLLAVPGGVESPGDENPLIPIAEHTYRLGTDERSPEQLTFAMFIDGQPHEARLNGCRYHRTFTP
jgi:CubicO group peptidase (beta-lactamase class C family)